MTPEQFCYWLQGYSEINGRPPDPNSWKIIQDHLKLVFDKKTPNYLTPAPLGPIPRKLFDTPTPIIC